MNTDFLKACLLFEESAVRLEKLDFNFPEARSMIRS